MATNYPGALDTLTNPIGTDALNNATTPHATQHTDANDAIEAIQAELGVNPKGSSATVVARLNGTAVLGAANAFTVGGHTITAQSAAIIPLRINGAASQSGNLLEFRNSGGTVLSSVSSAGQGLFPSVFTASVNNSSAGSNAQVSLPTTGASITTGVASNVTLKIQNTNASPTGDLQQWINTGGTPLASVNSTGTVLAQNIQLAVGTLATTGTVNLDFNTEGYETQAALTGNVTYTASNYAAGKSVTVRVINGGTQRTLTFPTNWVFVGTKPSNIAANKTGVLTVTSFGTTEADCVAAWAVQA